MPATLSRERPERLTEVTPFLRALRQLARTTPIGQSLPTGAAQQWAKLKPAELAKRMDTAETHVRALLELFGVLTHPSGTPAQRRTAAQREVEALIARGELLASADFALALGTSRQALSKAVAAQRVFFLEHAGGRYFPAFFLDPKYQRSHLEQVSKCLGELPGASKLQFFQSKKASLGGLSPLEALAKGKLTLVKKTATAFAER